MRLPRHHVVAALFAASALSLSACSGATTRHVAATLSATPSVALAENDAPLPPGTSPLPGPTSVAPLPVAADVDGATFATVRGLPPVIYNVETTQPVVFLTIDDGYVHDPQFPALFRSAHIPVTLFLTDTAIDGDYNYFRTLQSLGAVIEDHTLDHPVLTRMSYLRQEHEICTTADTYTTEFGVRPTLFRPPYGDYNLATLVAATNCRLGPVVLWDAAVNDGRLSYAQGDRLRPGDIILMHFRTTVREDFAAAVEAIRAAGLRVAQLATYVRYDAPTVNLPPPVYPTPAHTWSGAPATASATPTPSLSSSATPSQTASLTQQPSPTAQPTGTASATQSTTPSTTPTPVPTLTGSTAPTQ